jgi:hypothetical protein
MQISRTRGRRATIGPAWSARRAVQRDEFHRVAPGAAPVDPVLSIHDKLSAVLGRTLRILCVGSGWELATSQLAARGAIVHNELAIDFATANVSGDCDLALVDGDGLAARSSLPALRASIGAIVIAAARSSSGETRPAGWLTLRDTYAFVQELGQAASGRRPDKQLWFASNRYWLLSDEIGVFDQFTSEPHSAARGTHEGTRRYYLGDGRLVKHFVFDNARRREINLKELRGEIRFLRNPPPGIEVPRLIATGERQDEGWLIRDCFEGKLLLNLMRDGARFNAHTVLHDVLSQLVVLEAAGLYHNDVRPWNVLVAPDGRASLIDYGAISPDPGDCDLPSNLFLAFLVFACEVWGGTSSRLHGACLPRFDPDHLPPPYRSAFWSMLQSPPSQWRFASLLDDILNPKIVERLDTVGLPAVLRAANECAIRLDARFTQSAADLTRSREAVRQVETREAALTVALSVKDAEIAELLSDIRAANQRVSSLAADLASSAAMLETKKAELETNRVELETKKAEIETSRAELETSRAELETKKAEIETKNTEIEALRSEVHTIGRREAHLAANLAATTKALEKRAAGIKALRAKVHDAGRREESLTANLAARTGALEVSRADAARRAANEALLQQQLIAYRHSTSWRLTAPLRLLRRLFDRFVGSRTGGIAPPTPPHT